LGLQAFARGEKVEELPSKAAGAKRPLLMSVVNWGEVYYAIWRAHGEKAANIKLQETAQLPVELTDVDAELARPAPPSMHTAHLAFFVGHVVSHRRPLHQLIERLAGRRSGYAPLHGRSHQAYLCHRGGIERVHWVIDHHHRSLSPPGSRKTGGVHRCHRWSAGCIIFSS